jgi:16S rRNA (adenine1518-N6/adenine1519-N6)-dimethyltransferase
VDAPRADFFRVVKAAFGQRRKALSNALMSLGLDKQQVNRALQSAGVDAGRRGETLSLQEFAAITRAVSSVRNEVSVAGVTETE